MQRRLRFPLFFLTAIIALAIFLVGLSGCAATKTSLAKKDLDVQTQMSEAIF